jgi:hypothetical protein
VLNVRVKHAETPSCIAVCLCRSKIIVARSPQAALQPLAHHLHGIDNVPVAWGGKCNLPFEQYPGHRQLLQLVEKLNARSV